MPTIPVENEPVFYAERGREAGHPPVVLVHGSGSSHRIWNGQLAALADTTRACALDLPGHGRSKGQGRASVAGYAEIVRGWMDALGMRRVVIGGHSLGGAIAQWFALTYPDRAAGVILVGTGARLRVLPAFLSGILTDFEPTVREINRNCFAPDAPADMVALSEADMRRCAPRVVHDDFAACNAFDVMSRISEIRVPALIFCGREDRMTPVKYSEFLASQIATAELHLVDHAGHNVMLEQAQAVNTAMIEWIRKMSE